MKDLMLLQEIFIFFIFFSFFSSAEAKLGQERFLVAESFPCEEVYTIALDECREKKVGNFFYRTLTPIYPGMAEEQREEELNPDCVQGAQETWIDCLKELAKSEKIQ